MLYHEHSRRYGGTTNPWRELGIGDRNDSWHQVVLAGEQARDLSLRSSFVWLRCQRRPTGLLMASTFKTYLI